MIIGFTGTRNGMTSEQKDRVRKLLIRLNPDQVHHGDCVGADADFHHICRELDYYVIGHPGIDINGMSPWSAHCDVDESVPAMGYLDRNDIIVELCDVLIAAPLESKEQLRSGTWHTIRKGLRKLKDGRSVYIVYPDGVFRAYITYKKEETL